MFCLYWDAKTKTVRSLNGSGRSAKNSSVESVRKALDLKPNDKGGIPALSGLAVTVPGAAAGWYDTVKMFGSGKVTLEQILMPAIELGEQGFPVSELAASFVCLTQIVVVVKLIQRLVGGRRRVRTECLT